MALEPDAGAGGIGGDRRGRIEEVEQLGRGPVRREPLGRRRDRLRPQRHLDEHAEGAERPDHQPRHVVAGHVLHRRSPAAHDASVGAYQHDLEHGLAQRPGAEAAPAREPGRQRAADRRVGITGVERALLADGAQRGRELGAGRAGADGHRHVGGLHVEHTRRVPGPRSRRAPAHRSPAWVPAPTATTAGGVPHLRADVRVPPPRGRSHPRPGGDRGDVAAAAPLRQHLVGVRDAVGVEGVAQRGLEVEVVGA